MTLKVYVTAHGKRSFRIEKINKNTKQFKGSYKLPKNITLSGGEKWVKLNYWFTEDQIIK